MPVFVATSSPLTYSRPVVPLSVTATCDHWPSASGAVPFRRCSPPPPEVVIAKRGAEPALAVRNMLRAVLAPKSKIRDHVGRATGFTQVEIVKSVSPLTTPAGNCT